ncbi:MAG: hypothetical protein PUF48_03250 [Oscillospiraceae bacterium]|nr:hypothetical protein [Oscillospiraceae bacterium]
MKTYKKIISLLVCVVLLFSFSVTAYAGSIVDTLDKSSFDPVLSPQKWHNVNQDVTAKDGKIIFPKESNANTKLVWKTPTAKSSYYKKLIEGDLTIKFTKLPANETFILGFAMKGIEPKVGGLGNIEVQFKNKGGIYVSVVSYASGEVTLAAPKKVGSVNSNLKISFLANTNDTFTLSVNGVSICKNLNLKSSAEGRVGFMQTGNCGAEISDLNFTSYAYDAPENVNIFEDFNDGEFNANLFTTSMPLYSQFPAFADIREYNGHKGLFWKNARCVYFSTNYCYSNFELSYDVVFQQNYDILSEDGRLIAKATPQYFVRLGCDANQMTYVNWSTSAYAKQVVLGNGNQFVVSGGDKHYGSFTKPGFNFFDEKTSEKGYTFKIKMVDGVLTGYAKWLSEKDFGDPIFVIDEKENPTPYGFVQIIGADNTTMMLDNIRVTNLDNDPNLIDVEFKTNKQELPKDFNYVPLEDVYMPETDAIEEAGFNFYIITVVVALVSVIAVVVTLLTTSIIRKKRLKKAGETADE